MYRFASARPKDWGFVRKTLGWGLVLFLLSGVVTVPEVWAATYYVDAVTGDDLRTPATAQDSLTPWQTLSKALASVASGDVVQVASGTYDTALGESFPLELQNGVVIQGAGKATTTLSGPAGIQVFENIDTPLASGTSLTGFTLTHDGTSPGQSLVHLMPNSVAMAPAIHDNAFVALDGTEYGLYVDSDGASTAARSYGGTISNNNFDGFYVGLHLSADLQANPGGSFILSPAISGNTFTDNSYAIDVSLGDFEGTLFEDSTQILDNVATGSLANDVHYYANFQTGNASMQPLISGNTFTGAGSDSIWMSIERLGAYNPSPSGIDLATGSPTITNNTIDHPSGNGIYVDYSYATSSVVMHPEISGNHVTMPGSDGIYFQIFEDFAADPADVQITITNNSVTDADGDGIHLSGTSFKEHPTFSNATTTISGNVIDNPGSTGIFDSWQYGVGAYGTLSRVISGNTVTHGNNGDAIFADGHSQSTLDAANLEIRDNVVDEGFGHGILLAYDDWPESSQVLATCNAVTNNDVGFEVSGSSTSANEAADLGGGSGSPGLNSLFDNTTDLAAQVDGISAQSNWWGTTSVPTILSHIGGAYAGGVDFSSFLSSPPSVNAANDLTASISGNVITYTATLEGTGQCGCASSTFTAPTPAHTTIVPGSVTVSGATGPSVQGEDPLEVWVGELGAGEMVDVSWMVQIDPGYTGDVSEQASFGCTQLAAVVASDDPSTAPDGDPTIISVVSVGGSVSGLAGGQSVVLQNNATDDLTISSDGPFQFATVLAPGSTYVVTVKTQPTDQTCMVTNGSGTVVGGNITNVAISCAANKLAFTTQPSGGTSGIAWTTQPVVTIQDPNGSTVTNSTASVMLTITPGTGTSGALLACAGNPVNASGGVAIFADCEIDKAGTGYTLTATATGLTAVISSAFDITVSAPGVPANVTTMPGDHSVTVSWGPPTTGGQPERYRAEALLNGVPTGLYCEAIWPATSCTIEGLTNGLIYTISVVAINAAGPSPVAAISDPVIPGLLTIPALSPWGLLILSTLMLGFAGWELRRRNTLA